MKFLSLLIFTFSLSVFSQIHDINQFEEMFKKVNQVIGSGVDPSEIILVFDIDNNLMSTVDDFASDQWTGYQAELILNGKADKAISSELQDLFELWAVALEFQDMELIEDSLPKMLAKAQNKGVHSIALSARGTPLMSNSTQWLEKLGMSFKKDDAYQVSFEIMPKEFERPMKFENGIGLVSGGHKGIALKTILETVDKKYKHIFFSDDHERNLKKVIEIFGGREDVTLHSYRYGGMDEVVKRFKRSKKLQARATAKYHEAISLMCDTRLSKK